MPTALEGVCRSRHPWQRNLLFAWLSQFFSLAGFCFGMPFIAFYFQELGVSEGPDLYLYVGLFTAMAPVAMAVMGPLWGSLGDQYGRKLMMVRASTAATFVLFGMGYASSVGGVLVFRFLQGFFTGTMPAAQTLVAAEAPEAKQGTALGLLQTASFSGIMAGGFIGGRCADAFGYASTFRIGGCMMIVSTLLILFGVQEDFSPPAVEVGAERKGFFSFPPMGATLPVLVVIALVGVARFFDRPILPLFVQFLNGGVREGAATITGDLTALSCAAGIVGALGFGWLVDRFSPAAVGKAIVAAMALALAVLSHARSIAFLFVVRTSFAFFSIGFDPVLHVWLSRNTPTASRGSAFGWATSFRCMGWIVGPLAGTGMATWFASFGWPSSWVLPRIFLIEAILLALLVPVFGWAGRRMEGGTATPEGSEAR